MAHPNEDLLREGVAAFQRGDLDALREKYFAENIRWHTPGKSPIAGDYEGVAQVIEAFGRLFELTGGTYRVELHDVIANDEHGVVLFTARAERAGRQLDDRSVLVCHIRDGKQAETWIRPGDLYALDEFLS